MASAQIYIEKDLRIADILLNSNGIERVRVLGGYGEEWLGVLQATRVFAYYMKEDLCDLVVLSGPGLVTEQYLSRLGDYYEDPSDL